MKVIKPPKPTITMTRPVIFLAGSIEMGAAEDWQKQVEDALKDYTGTILNPRRDDWDSSWKQEFGNNQFTEQVQWEMSSLERADHIVMYLDPETQSPISLLELGLHANSRKLVVCCPKGFWRKGNVDVVCDEYNIPQVDSLKQLIRYAKKNFPIKKKKS